MTASFPTSAAADESCDALRAASDALLTDDLEAALTGFLGHTLHVARAEAACLLLQHPESDDLFVAATTDRDNDKRAKLASKRGLAGKVLETGTAIHANDLAEAKEFDAKIDQPPGVAVRQIVVCPLRHGDLVFGVLQVYNSTAAEGFGDGDVVLLQTAANMAALALRHHRAYAKSFSALTLSKAERETKTPMLGKAPDVQALRDLLPRLAMSDACILIRGESGVGKEVIAQLIWKASKRRNKPFVAVNCAAIPPTLIESELFGHEKGAFTGAHALRKGRFEAADKGTIFLDEIGELPVDMQAKLLRVLQEMEFTRVGATKATKVDVRVLAATNRDLEAAVKARTFREDLFYRLNVVPITLPPLRNRPEDIETLIDSFLAEFNAANGRSVEEVTAECRAAMRAYRWPGNIRELRNVMERMVVLSEGPVLDVSALPPEIQPGAPPT